jgi:hypothetical protein
MYCNMSNFQCRMILFPSFSLIASCQILPNWPSFVICSTWCIIKETTTCFAME